MGGGLFVLKQGRWSVCFKAGEQWRWSVCFKAGEHGRWSVCFKAGEVVCLF